MATEITTAAADDVLLRSGAATYTDDLQALFDEHPEARAAWIASGQRGMSTEGRLVAVALTLGHHLAGEREVVNDLRRKTANRIEAL